MVSVYEEKFKFKMDKWYRPRIEKMEIANGNKTLSFPQFIEHISAYFRYFKCNMSRCNHTDAHWMPYVDSCQFCNIRYSAIAKLETMDEDIK